MLTKQNTETGLGPEKETIMPEQTVNYPQLPPLPEPSNLGTKSAPTAPVKSAITIISKPIVIEPERGAALPEIASYKNPSSDSETENNTQSGITKTDKYPTRKEIQEMQSKGIVLY